MTLREAVSAVNMQMAMEKMEISPAAMASQAINRIDKESLLVMPSRVPAFNIQSKGHDYENYTFPLQRFSY